MHQFASIDSSEFVLHRFYQADLSLTNDLIAWIWLVLRITRFFVGYLVVISKKSIWQISRTAIKAGFLSV